MAEETIVDVDASSIWPGKVVTEISGADRSWEAGADDQDYLQCPPERLRRPLLASPAAGPTPGPG